MQEYLKLLKKMCAKDEAMCQSINGAHKVTCGEGYVIFFAHVSDNLKREHHVIININKKEEERVLIDKAMFSLFEEEFIKMKSKMIKNHKIRKITKEGLYDNYYM